MVATIVRVTLPPDAREPSQYAMFDTEPVVPLVALTLTSVRPEGRISVHSWPKLSGCVTDMLFVITTVYVTFVPCTNVPLTDIVEVTMPDWITLNDVASYEAAVD